MTIKVFLSHQLRDAAVAQYIERRLRIVHDIPSYLDVIDPDASKQGDEIADHVKAELGKCTQLLAVVSEATKLSWWVPWEIGIATEKDYPLATFSGQTTMLPEYLRKWPYLRTDADIDAYANASKAAERDFNLKKTFLTEGVARVRSTKGFYTTLAASLGR